MFKSFFLITSLSTVLLTYSTCVLAAETKALITFAGDTVHFEAAGQTSWVYDVQKGKEKGKSFFTLLLPKIEESSKRLLNSFKSELVTDVKVLSESPDGKTLIRFNLSMDEVESFDYLTEQPSRLILDFFVSEKNRAKLLSLRKPIEIKEEKTIEFEKAPLVSEKKESKTKPAVTKTVISEVKKAERKPAATDIIKVSTEENPLNLRQAPNLHAGIFDGADSNYERFEIKDFEIKPEAILKSKENYYIPYPLLEAESRYWDRIKKTPPIYQITPKDSLENKQMRLLLSLFEQKKFATYLKTLEYFRDKYPETEFDEMLMFMTADLFYKMWEDEKQIKYFDKAMSGYANALLKYPTSILAERTSLLMGYANYDRGDYLTAIKLFNEHILSGKYSKGDGLSIELAKLGTGLSFNKIKKFDEAIDQFDLVEGYSEFRDLKVEAAYRKGDVFLNAKKYDKAVDAYKKALKDYPESQQDYPSSYYNQAEALFWQNKYKQSLDVHREYLKRFPTHFQNAFAMTRVGELLDILGADKSKVMGAFLETYFRYGDNQNAIIARLKLLSSRMKSMKDKELNQGVSEIMTLAKKVELPKMEQFSTILIADGFTQRNNYEKAFELLVEYYQKNPQAQDLEVIKTKIVSNIVNKMKTEVEKENFFAAFKTQAKYSDTWLKSSKRLDTQYFLGRAFELGGSKKEAQKKYLDVLNKLYAVKGTEEEQELRVLQYLPTTDQLNLRLAAVNFEQNDMAKAYEYLKNIKIPEQLKDTEQIERVQLAVSLLEKKGDSESAIRYLTELLKTWHGEPHLVADPYLKLGELELKQNQKNNAIKSFVKVDQLYADSNSGVSETTHARALELLGKTYLDSKQTPEAVATYEKLLEKYEDKKPLASIRYKLGQIYFDKGEMQKAADAWSTFKQDKNDFWKKLAQEQLQNSSWRDDYKKYIKRIPAMAESPKENK